jgi:hypothetical protein
VHCGGWCKDLFTEEIMLRVIYSVHISLCLVLKIHDFVALIKTKKTNFWLVYSNLYFNLYSRECLIPYILATLGIKFLYVKSIR